MRALLLVLLLAPSVAPAAPLTLADALARAVERGPEAEAARATVAPAQAEVHTAGMLPNPTLLVGAGRSEPQLYAAAQVRLPIFGTRGAHVVAAQQGVAQARAEAEAALWRLRHDVRIAYWTAARAVEESAIAVEVEQLTGRVAGAARERFEAGAGTLLEQNQAALLHRRAEREIADRRAAERIARLDLARLLGTSAEDVAVLADRLEVVGPTPPLERLLDDARARHPELRALDAERQAALARAQAARADVRPVPQLELGAEVLDAATCGGSSRCVGPRGALSFDLPVLNLNGGPVARARSEAALAGAKAVAARARVEAAVRAAWENSVAATGRARFFDGEYVPAAQEVERMAREGFTSGKTGLLPLLEAERAVLEARLGRAQALFDVQAARADLEEASGVILDAP